LGELLKISNAQNHQSPGGLPGAIVDEDWDTGMVNNLLRAFCWEPPIPEFITQKWCLGAGKKRRGQAGPVLPQLLFSHLSSFSARIS
jgi:hypothetical protein